MAKIYFYYAFRNSEDDMRILKNSEYLQQTGLIFEVIARTGVVKPLAVVTDDDLLIIAAHGSTDDPGNLSLGTANGLQKMSASELADQLSSDGLKATHQSILLVTCEGGGNSTLKAGKFADPTGKVLASDIVVTKNKMGECLASIVGKAMGMKGYFSILVGGFPGIFNPISYSLNNSAAFRTTNDTRVLAQLDHIQWFDARGGNTAP